MLLAACLLFSSLLGCGRVSTADFSGYVKETATGQGIVGATVSVYWSDPGTIPSTATPFASTTTGYNSQIPGYYSHKLIWSSASPAFQDAGDVTTVWVVASHPDFGVAQAVQVSGIVSSGQNVAPDIRLVRTGFSAIVTGQVTSHIVVSAGPPPVYAGVSNVTVGIQLDATATTELDDYVTATTGSVSATGTTTLGVFTFSVPIKWTNALATSGTDTHTVKVWLTWPDLTVPATIGAGSKSYTVELASGTTPNIIGPFFIP
jgi:hypothetical protein